MRFWKDQVVVAMATLYPAWHLNKKERMMNRKVRRETAEKKEKTATFWGDIRHEPLNLSKNPEKQKQKQLFKITLPKNPTPPIPTTHILLRANTINPLIN